MDGHLLQHLLAHSARRYPDRVAVVFKETSATYADLEGWSGNLAAKLLKFGIQKGDRVGIMLPKSMESIISLFGILKTGAVYVPIDPYLPAARIDHIIQSCGIGWLITSPQQIHTLCDKSETKPTVNVIVLGKNQGEVGARAEFLAVDTAAHPAAELQPIDLPDSSPAYILHTSGSTGKPKGVVITHLNALTFVKMAAEFFGIEATDRFASHAPLHFDLSVFDLFVAVKCAATIVLVPEVLSKFPVALADFIEKQQITVWNSVSSVLTMLAEKGGLAHRDLGSLRIVHFSGDIMPVKYLRILKAHMPNSSFYNIYGQTEANSSMYYRIGELPADDSWRIPIGKPFPNFEVFAFNDARQLISRAGEEGELYVGGSTVALGYWGNEGLTGEKFVSDPRYPAVRKVVYRTGDLVKLDENGDYVFSGRKDHMIKSRGYRVELEEIETVLSGHAGIMTAIVIPIPDELIGNRIAAIIVPRTGCAVRREDVVGHCAARLPKYMIPDSMEIRESLPMTSSGKVDRKALTTLVAVYATGEGGEEWGADPRSPQ